MAVISGLERLISSRTQLVRDRKVGVVAHPASITSNYEHILDALLRCGADVRALFGPEHGFGGEAQDMEPVASNCANRCNPADIPVYSLYGKDEESLAPDPVVVSELDVLVVDLADVGSRYYTFVWTALLCLRICHRVGCQLVILDRPNPLNGETLEGEPQGDDFLSFVGLFPVPNRHGLTIGEILTMAAAIEGTGDVLEIVEMQGWDRAMFWDETGLPWVPPSPNMPSLNTAVVYPGGCLVEATELSEGRGTTTPFELSGAPGLHSGRLCSALNRLELPGVVFRQHSFRPMFQKHENTTCKGMYIHVTCRNTFAPYRTGLAFLATVHGLFPDAFAWREAPYEFVTDIPAIDLLCGNAEIRSMIEQNASVEDMARTWQDGQREFMDTRLKYLLY